MLSDLADGMNVRPSLIFLIISVNKGEAEALCHVFKSFCPAPKMDRTRFRDILHNSFCMTEDLIMDRGRSMIYIVFYNTNNLTRLSFSCARFTTQTK